jgi:hypothetical protein
MINSVERLAKVTLALEAVVGVGVGLGSLQSLGISAKAGRRSDKWSRALCLQPGGQVAVQLFYSCCAGCRQKIPTTNRGSTLCKFCRTTLEGPYISPRKSGPEVVLQMISSSFLSNYKKRTKIDPKNLSATCRTTKKSKNSKYLKD